MVVQNETMENSGATESQEVILLSILNNPYILQIFLLRTLNNSLLRLLFIAALWRRYAAKFRSINSAPKTSPGNNLSESIHRCKQDTRLDLGLTLGLISVDSVASQLALRRSTQANHKQRRLLVCM